MKYLLTALFLFPCFAWSAASDNVPMTEVAVPTGDLIDASQLDTSSMLNANEVAYEASAGTHEYNEADIDRSEFESMASEEVRNTSCNVNSKEETVCANIMCDFGLLFGEWPSECTDYKAKLLVLKATTPPWKSMPKCFMRDSSCTRSGKGRKRDVDESFCNSMELASDRHACLLGLEIDEKESARKYVESSGGNASDVDGIEFIDPLEQTEEEEVEDSLFLVESVDERFLGRTELSDEDLLRKYWRFNVDTGEDTLFTLNYYLENREDLAKAEDVNSAAELLISNGAMLEQCMDVPYEEFYNCNYYPDLPKECWAKKTNSEIALCAKEYELAAN